jgi:hypothetical protein
MKRAVIIAIAFITILSVVVLAEDPGAAMLPDTGMPSPSDASAAPALPADANAAPALPDDSNAAPALPADSNAAPALPADSSAVQADANSSLPDANSLPGANGAAPADVNPAQPADANPAQQAGANASLSADANASLPGDANGSISADANLTLPGEDNGAQQVTPQASGTDNQSATNSINAAPEGKEDANIMFNSDSGSGGVSPQQGASAKGANAGSAKKAVHAFPEYLAVPLTNDLRVMDKKTGELGETDSLKRYMDWTVSSSSQMKKQHAPDNTEDLNAYTAWVTRKGDNGIGESLTLHFDPVYFAAMQEGGVNSVKITGLKIINGYNKSHDDWFNNDRVRTMKIYHNNRPFCNIRLYDTTNWQEITFKTPMIIRPDDKIKAVITDYFEGYKYPNACITEFLPVGQPNGTVVGADYLNGKSKAIIRNGGMFD